MADLSIPNFSKALPEPRVTLPDDARSNTGLALASGALSSITSIANNYMQARQTKDQASAIGEAMLGSSDPSVQEAGRMYKSLSKTMPVNYFALSGANGRNSTGAVQGGMLDDAIKLIRDQQLQSQRKELLELEQSSRERLLGLQHGNRLDIINAEGAKSKDVMREQSQLQEAYAERRFDEQANLKMGDMKIRENILNLAEAKEVSAKEADERQSALDQIIDARSKMQITTEDFSMLVDVLEDPNQTSESIKKFVAAAITKPAMGAQRASSATTTQSAGSGDDDYIQSTINTIKK